MVTDLFIVRDRVEVRLLQGQLVAQSADQHKNKCSDNVYLPALLGNYYRPAAAADHQTDQQTNQPDRQIDI